MGALVGTAPGPPETAAAVSDGGQGARAPPAAPAIRLSIVLPAYNEAASVGRVVEEHCREMARLDGLVGDWEVVCLDDASTDDTSQVLDRLAAGSKHVRVLRHARNKGIAASFRDLFQAARGTHVYLTAADGQWPARYLAPLLQAVADGDALAVGVRTNRRQVYGWRRLAVSTLFNTLPVVCFGVRTRDAGSVKLGRRELFVADLVSTSPFAEAERIVYARRQGLSVAFVPIEFEARATGTERGARTATVVAAVRDCIRCLRIYGPGT